MTNLKPIRFDESLNFPGEYSCESGEGHSGEYFKAEDVREAMAGLVEALNEICAVPDHPMRKKCKDIARNALAALPSPPQAQRKEAE